MAEVYYHATVSAFGGVAAARKIQIGRWLTFAISPAAPTEATPARHLATK
jgi:hypothetical protein